LHKLNFPHSISAIPAYLAAKAFFSISPNEMMAKRTPLTGKTTGCKASFKLLPAPMGFTPIYLNIQSILQWAVGLIGERTVIDMICCNTCTIKTCTSQSLGV
jgi:hypothetical protein